MSETGESIPLSTDPQTWTSDDVDRFALVSTPEQLVDVLLELAASPSDESLRVLRLFLGARHGSNLRESVPMQAAVMVLISLGQPGVLILQNALIDSIGATWNDREQQVRRRTPIMASLYFASRGEPMPWPAYVPRVQALETLVISSEARAAAAQGLRNLVAECLVNPPLFGTVVDFIQTGHVLGRDSPGDFGSDVIRLMADSSIRLSPSIIAEYRGLLSERLAEERYQQFLAAHPVFLDPLSDRVVPKQRLGTEFATDFAVRRLDGRWLLIEIEKPHDRIFTLGHDFTAEFTHGFGQVLDFQHWVDDNVAYAQRHMDDITAPRGLLVIGMRDELDNRAQAKLRRFADNSARIDVVTFDDLLVGAENLYAALHNAQHRDAAS